jgi:hypothetical protein
MDFGVFPRDQFSIQPDFFCFQRHFFSLFKRRAAVSQVGLLYVPRLGSSSGQKKGHPVFPSGRNG